jgi:hypothetical protein
MTAGRCVVCRQPCIAMCPACGRFVHHAYGQANENCSGRHEEACPGTRDPRELSVEQMPESRAAMRSPPGSRVVKKKPRGNT